VNYLLDTHALLWAIFSPERLGRKAVSILADPGVDVCVSSVSFWEISLKFAIGKLELTNVLPDDLPSVVRESGFDILTASAEEMATFHRLPRLEHKDPFDRLIVWQAICNRLCLVSADKALREYHRHGLKQIW